MTAVVTRGLTQRFGSNPVLSGVDLVVDRGEHVTISGPNGAGKTTLLRILAGLLHPTGGTVVVLDGSTGDPAVRRRLGVIAHSSSLYLRMTVQENLRFWAGMYDDPSAAGRGAELLAVLGLDPRDGRPVAAYSQGMRQRAAVARALATGPELVLADEPAAGLDAEGAATVAGLLGGVETVVTATHQPAHAGRSFVLDRGRLSGA